MAIISETERPEPDNPLEGTVRLDGAPPVEEGKELDRRSASAFQVFGQSVAATGPSIAISGTIAVVYLNAGNGTIWSYIFATIVLVLVGYIISVFARRTAAAGSLYSYTSLGLGKGSAFVGGWGLIFGYVLIGAACLSGSSLYVGSFLSKFGLNGASRAYQVPLVIVIGLIAAYIPLRGVHVSTLATVILELVSLIAIFVLVVALFVHFGAHIDTAQFKAKGATTTGIVLGTVLAFGAFTGFESSASLGIEAKHPHKAIPRAVLLTVVGAGVLYIIAAYAQVLGFGSASSLAQASAPLNALATTANIGWLAYPLDIAVAIAALACSSACLNAASRGLYSLGREEVLPASFGRSHATYKTPHIALYVLTPVLIAVPAIILAYGTAPLNVFSYLGTPGTFGYLVAYVLVAISAPIYLARRKAFSILTLVVSVLVTVAVAYVFYKNLVPVPPSPYNILPYIFFAWAAIGIVWYLVLKVKNPERAARLGSLQEVADLESVIALELSDQ